MNHKDHVYLLDGNPGVREQLDLPIRGATGNWADLGSGGGAFTLALADLLASDAVIYSVDRSGSDLRRQEMSMRSLFPGRRVTYCQTDFTRALDLPLLDGVIMANSLHFLTDKEKSRFLSSLHGLIRPGGQLVLVEYNTDRGNMWVPYPLSLPTWKKLARDTSFGSVIQLGARPSSFLKEIYSAVCRIE